MAPLIATVEPKAGTNLQRLPEVYVTEDATIKTFTRSQLLLAYGITQAGLVMAKEFLHLLQWFSVKHQKLGQWGLL